MRKTKTSRQRFDATLFCQYYEQLSRCSGLTQIAQYPQHGNTSRLLHSVAVAYYSYRLAAAAPATFHMHEMVRGALFHDYFFYIALENAQKELLLTGIETDIIRSHMFPLTLRPPHFRESALVSLMDKACSVYEFFRRKDPYRSLRSVLAGLPVHPVLCPQATEA